MQKMLPDLAENIYQHFIRTDLLLNRLEKSVYIMVLCKITNIYIDAERDAGKNVIKMCRIVIAGW